MNTLLDKFLKELSFPFVSADFLFKKPDVVVLGVPMVKGLSRTERVFPWLELGEFSPDGFFEAPPELECSPEFRLIKIDFFIASFLEESSSMSTLSDSLSTLKLLLFLILKYWVDQKKNPWEPKI